MCVLFHNKKFYKGENSIRILKLIYTKYIIQFP